MRFGVLLGPVSGLALALAVVSHARAQEVDYGALEEIFGQAVTTSATGSPQLAAQAPADMQIITADDIRRSGATNIPDILNFVAGIDVRREGALDSDVSIRGFSQSFNPRLLVLVNGRQVYIDDDGYVAWQAIPVQLAEIRQIEVVRGPASALFGFNAASGVINIITYAPLSDKINNLSASYGTDGTLLGSLVSTVQEPGKGGLRISLGGLRTNEYSKTAADPGGYGVARPEQGSFSLSGQYKPTGSTDVSLDVSDSTANSFSDADFSPSDGIYRVQSVKLGVSADTNLGLASLQGYTNRVTSKFIGAGSPGGVDSQNQISVVQASDLIKFANVHAVRLGLEFRENRAWGGGFSGTTKYQDYAADVMWNWQITPEIALTNAGRIDHLVLGRDGLTAAGSPYSQAAYNSATITAPSFNSGLVYQPTASDTIRLLAGRGLQAPSLVDFGVQVGLREGPFTVAVVGNPAVKPSTVTNYEVDYDHMVAALSSTVSTALYYQLNRDFLISAVNTPPVFHGTNIVTLSQNIGNAEALGGEIGVTGSNAAGWRWNLSYSLFTVHQDLVYAPPAIPLDFSSSTPTSEVDFGLGYSWNQWEADAEGKYQSRYTDNREEGNVYVPVPVSNFVSLNARLGYNVTDRLTVAVTGSELTAPQITETAALPPDRRVLFTATYGF